MRNMLSNNDNNIDTECMRTNVNWHLKHPDENNTKCIFMKEKKDDGVVKEAILSDQAYGPLKGFRS